MGKKKLTYGFVKHEFEKDNYSLLSSEYSNCRTKLKYRCSKGIRILLVGIIGKKDIVALIAPAKENLL